MLRLWRAMLEEEQLERKARKEFEKMASVRCGKCNIRFASLYDFQKHICEKEYKMTREEAIDKVINSKKNSSYRFESERGYAEAYVDALEKLGVLNCEEENKLLYSVEFVPNADFGLVKLELQREGLVLWVGGEIVYKSWEKIYRKGDVVTFHNSAIYEKVGIIK